MGFLNLPNEILLSIADILSVDDLPDLASSCPELSSLLTLYLYERLLRECDTFRPTPLRWAAKYGHARLAELAISRGAKIDERGPGVFSLTPLHLAASFNHPLVIRILAKHGARIDAEVPNRVTPLCLAASGNMEATRVLLTLGAKMMYSDASRQSPVYVAAARGGVGCMKAFIEAGFGVGTRVYGDRTVLHGAVLGGDLETLEYLLRQEGAETAINAQDRYLKTPLHYATSPEGNFQAGCVRPLLRHGADMYLVDGWGSTPAHCAVYATKREEFGCIGALLAAGFDFNTKGGSGRTILHEAVFGARIEMLEYLLGKPGAGVAINAQDRKGERPLHLAVHSRGGFRSKLVRLLLHHGADMYAVNHDGDTPAHHAVHAEEPYEFACITAFLDAGFDFNSRGRKGRTILHEAVFSDSEGMLLYLLKQAGVGVAINAQDSDGSTPLYLAAGGRGGWKKARVLLEHGADIGVRDIQGDTAAHEAAVKGNVPCMKALLAAGFDINTRGNKGQTILHRAVIGGEGMVEYLLGKRGGAIIINAQDSGGLTPIAFAARHGNSLSDLGGVMKLLLQYGADPKGNENSRNNSIARGLVKGVGMGAINGA